MRCATTMSRDGSVCWRPRSTSSSTGPRATWTSPLSSPIFVAVPASSRERETVTDFETILLERTGRVAVITLNRPKALNALNTQVLTDITAALDEVEADAGIGAVVLTGSEKAFAAGADIKEMQSKSYMDMFLA